MLYCRNISVKDHPVSGPSFSVFPNPANDILNIEIYADKSANTTYTVYGVLGNVILQKTLNAGSEKYKERIDISTLEKGLYFIELVSEGIATTKKIIKN